MSQHGFEIGNDLAESVSIADDRNSAIAERDNRSKAIYSQRTRQQHDVRAGQAQIADSWISLRIISEPARIFALRYDNLRSEERGQRSRYDQARRTGQKTVEQRDQLRQPGSVIWLYRAGCNQFGPVRFKVELIE